MSTDLPFHQGSREMCTTHEDRGAMAFTGYCRECWDAQRKFERLTSELAALLEEIVRYPHHSHPGQPAVSYQHKPVALHERAMDALRRFKEQTDAA